MGQMRGAPWGTGSTPLFLIFLLSLLHSIQFCLHTLDIFVQLTKSFISVLIEDSMEETELLILSKDLSREETFEARESSGLT